jgi:hypothetical protein
MISKMLLVLMAVLGSMGLFRADVARSDSRTRALWVFSDELTNPQDRSTLVQRSADSGVNALYLSVYRSTPNSAGRYMYEDSAMADLIGQANAKQIQVWAAYGAPDWPTLGCATTAFPLQRMAEVISYTIAYPSAKFEGVVLDVEPTEPQSEAAFQNLLTLYQCIHDTLQAAGLKLAVAIRFFWDTSVTFPAGGSSKPAYQHIIDMHLDKVVVMGYRDFAGTANCDQGDGIICLDQDEIAYADSQSKNGHMLVGLETADCSPGCGPQKVTFFEEGQAVLNTEAQLVAQQFGTYVSFGGFAIHRYKDAYLQGTTAWPAVNPNAITLLSLTAASSLPAALPVPALAALGGLAAVAALGIGTVLVKRRREMWQHSPSPRSATRQR